MKKNKFGYLGLLGFLGILGIKNPWLWSLCGYFALFVLLKADERTDKDIGRACRNAFIYDTVLALAIVLAIFFNSFDSMVPIAILLSEGVAVFSLSLLYYQTKGD